MKSIQFNLVLVMCLMAFNLFSQQTVNLTFAEEFNRDEILTSQQQQQVRDAINDKLNDYIRYATLFNPETRRIDRVSIEKFEELFTLDPRLFDDMRENPDAAPIPIDGYLSNALTFFPLDGLSFGLNSAVAKEVSFDPYASRYTVVVEVSKTMLKFFSMTGEVIKGNKTYELDFIFTLKLDDLENTRIQTIRLAYGVKAADYYSTITSFGAGAFLTLPSFDGTANTGTLDLEPGIGFQAGLGIMSNFFNPKAGPNKALFFAGDIDFHFQQIKATLQGYQVSAVDNSISATVPSNSGNLLNGQASRSGSEIDVTEDVTMIGLTVPIGIGFRIMNKNTSSAFLKVQYAPSYLLSASGEFNDSKGNYSLDLDYPGYISYNSSDPKAYNPNSVFETVYDIGMDKAINRETTLTSKLSHGILFSGTFLKDLRDDDPTFGLGIDLFYYLPLTDPWELATAGPENPFLYPDEEINLEDGVISQFMENMRLARVGVKLRVYLKNKRRP